MREQFKPHSPEYEKVEDLPEDKQEEFINQDDGFVRKEAHETLRAAKRQAYENVRFGKLEGRTPEDIMHAEAIRYDQAREELLSVLSGKGYHPESSDKIIEKTPALAEDRGLLMLGVKLNPQVLQYASPELKNDKELVSAAIAGGAWAIQYASEELRRDRDLILKACKKDGQSLGFADKEAQKEFLKDREVVLVAVRTAGNWLEKAKDFQDDKEVVLAAVSQWGCYAQYASPRLKEDREVALAATTSDGYSMEYLSKKWREDKEIVLNALKHGGTLHHASERLRDDKEVILTALAHEDPKYQSMGLYSASERLKDDKEVALAAMRRDAGGFYNLSEHLKDDGEIARLAVADEKWGSINLGRVSERMKKKIEQEQKDAQRSERKAQEGPIKKGIRKILGRE